ncbi:MAG: class II fumarate hydratase [Kofleriaceae bacterium]|nr:class II fumarate hydratase [Myxococcales bacterium]MCB9559137.1 class II fumarate hydratase [Kofleriaceae bacterium]MCB9575047.1 class II fumarate hydratase [Kofleriaceae bacterium]
MDEDTAVTRLEHDSFGAIAVPAERLWGAQTQRSLQHFRISSETMPPELIAALARVKRAAAEVNAELGLLRGDHARAIVAACDEILAGRHPDEFPLSLWQTGSGTQTHMNVNEVIANRASELLGGGRGEERVLHPNDDVNRGQSSNDVFPTAMHVAAALAIVERLSPALDGLCATLDGLARRFAAVLKIGRTHLMDATPITLGQEISGWAAQLARGRRALEAIAPGLHELAIGGTAVGTGLNTHPEFGRRVAARLAAATGLPFVSAANKFESLASHDALVHAHGALRGLAVALIKIGNDVRWMASGPRAGLGEITIPENEPGSSIMPGKVNPTQGEALVMACTQVLGNDVTIGVAGAGGAFELNVAKPVIAHAFLQSVRLLGDAMRSFDEHCARGLAPRVDRLRAQVERSLMLVTALTPHLGYDRAAAIAHRAHADDLSLRDAALASGELTAAEFDAWVRPEAMV